MRYTAPLQIDGSRGEGGGQILRTALTLGLVVGRPLRFVRIREGRPKPGLRAQHLAAIEAAAAISGAEVEGAAVGSRALRFDPGPVRPGRYRFRIGTAGAASLVIQTVAIPLAMASGPSQVEVTGGTHVPWSPSAHYLTWHWAEWMRSVGLDVDLSTDGVGYYPKGGGRLDARLAGRQRPRPWRCIERGSLREVRGEVTISGLSRSIGDRIVREAGRLLAPGGPPAEIQVKEVHAAGPGVAFDLLARFESGHFATTALGRRGRPAEELAAAAVGDLKEFLRGQATVDRYLADQIVVPLALAEGESRFRTIVATDHLRTNAGTLALFGGGGVEIRGDEGEEADVRLRGGLS